jgi:hypothetical protein
MEMAQVNTKGPYIALLETGTYSFQTVEEFTYLGTCLTSKNEIRPEIEKRIATANRAYYVLHPI